MKRTIAKLLKFREDRNWTPFHTPAALSYAIACEAGELLQLFQWGKVPEIERVKEEVADVAIYCCYYAVAMGWEEDLSSCGWGSISAETGSINIFISAGQTLLSSCESTDQAILDIWLQCRMIAGGGEYNHLSEWINLKIEKNAAKYPNGVDHAADKGWVTPME